MELVLSLFPGIDLLGRGFAAEGFAVARGPDTLWDEHIEDFSVPPGRFDGIIGGPPCQNYSDANRDRDPDEGDRLVLEFLRLIDESRPEWFLMENVRRVPTVAIDAYQVQRLDITDAECGGKQKRLRHIQFGSRLGHIIRPERDPTNKPSRPAVLCVNDNRTHGQRLKDQGAPYFPLHALTRAAKARAVGNGVSWQVSTTLARAVTARSVVTPDDCICGCGRSIARSRGQIQATQACRKRMQRVRDGDAPRVLRYPAPR